MEIIEPITFLLVGAVAGWLAGLLLRGKGFGLLADMILGALGAFLGNLLADLLGIDFDSLWVSLGWATLGAIILLGLLRTLKRN